MWGRGRRKVPESDRSVYRDEVSALRTFCEFTGFTLTVMFMVVWDLHVYALFVGLSLSVTSMTSRPPRVGAERAPLSMLTPMFGMATLQTLMRCWWFPLES